MTPITSANRKPADLDSLLVDLFPKGNKVVAIKLPHAEGNPDVQIYIKEGSKSFCVEKIVPRCLLIENFLSVMGSSLF